MTTPVLLMISDKPSRVESLRLRLSSRNRWEIGAEATTDLTRLSLRLMMADLLVIDLDGLSDRSRGLGLVETCREWARPLPIVAVSGRYDEAEALAYFELGADEYLSATDHADRFSSVLSEVYNGSKVGQTRCDRLGIRDGALRTLTTYSN